MWKTIDPIITAKNTRPVNIQSTYKRKGRFNLGTKCLKSVIQLQKMIGKLGILITILSLVFLFFIVISLGAGAFSKKEKKPEIKKYLKSIYFLLAIIAILGSILVLFL